MSRGIIRPIAKRLLAMLGLRLVRIEQEGSPRETTRDPRGGAGLTPSSVSLIHPSLAFAPPGHFYSPIPDLAEVERRSGQLFRTDPRDLPGINVRETQQLELLEQCVDFYREQPFTAVRTEANRYFFENPAYSYSDAIFYYLMLRRFRPRRLIEVGSGYSTCVALDTSQRFLEGSVDITCIEPYPDLLRSLLRPSDTDRVTIRAEPLQDTPLSLFQSLGEDDMLFIDSTHVARIGSDVNRLFFEILPSLRPGVLIHVHDVFYPFEYPRHWLMEGRAWNEIYVLRAFLEFNDRFQIVLFNTYLTQNRRGFVEERFPLCLANEGGSLWLRRVKTGLDGPISGAGVRA